VALHRLRHARTRIAACRGTLLVGLTAFDMSEAVTQSLIVIIWVA
jgi:hypothetical protein